MRRLLFLLLPLGLGAGCSSPGEAYAAKHPELTPVQRTVMSGWKLPNGDAVAGLTKEQARLVMGREPDQFTTFNGEEAWVWSKRKLRGSSGPAPASSSSMAGDHSRESSPAETTTVQEETTVYFQNGRATRAVVREGGN